MEYHIEHNMRLVCGCLVVNVRYLKQRTNGYWWYQRRVPKALRFHFPTGWIQKALGTSDRDDAVRRHANFHAQITSQFEALLKADNASVSTRDRYGLAVALLATMGLKPGDGESPKALGGSP